MERPYLHKCPWCHQLPQVLTRTDDECATVTMVCNECKVGVVRTIEYPPESLTIDVKMVAVEEAMHLAAEAWNNRCTEWFL